MVSYFIYCKIETCYNIKIPLLFVNENETSLLLATKNNGKGTHLCKISVSVRSL